MTALILVTLFTLGVSAMCSLYEAVLYSARIAILEAARHGRHAKLAAQMIQLKTDISAPISAILILNTIANTAGATWAGIISAQVLPAPMVPVYMGGLVLGILFLSEIIPKTIGAIYWPHLWIGIVWPIIILRWALHPLIVAIQKITHVLTRGHEAHVVTEEEILALVNLGASEGHISEEESELVQNIIGLEDQHAKDVMTPRVVMFTLSDDTPISDALEMVKPVGFSRIPLYHEHPENIIGYLLRRDLTAAADTRTGAAVRSLAKPIEFVPESANCLGLLNRFLKRRIHIAMVTDEYGGLAGLITLEDLLETLLGSEIVDETDRVIDMQKAALSRRVFTRSTFRKAVRSRKPKAS